MTDRVRADRAFVCESCENRWYYTRQRCADCGSDDVETYPLEQGRVLATTTVHATPPGVRRPNALGLVRFDHVTIIAQLADETIAAGDLVEFGEDAALRGGDEPIEGPLLERSA